MSEGWTVIPLVNAGGDASISDLLAVAWDWRTLEEGIACENCSKQKHMEEKMFFEKTSDVIYFAFPRGTGTMNKGRVRMNRHKIFCTEKITCGAVSYSLRGLVEHVNGNSTDADSGHYIGWVYHEGFWLKYDDAHVSVVEKMPDAVQHGVVLAAYVEAAKIARPKTPTNNVEGDGKEEQEPISSNVATDTVLLPQMDGEQEFQRVVAALLEQYNGGQTCTKVLETLDGVSCETKDVPWMLFGDRLTKAAEEYMRNDLIVAEAVQLETPLWRTNFFPVVVLFEAWSKTTGLPTVFYLDAFYTLLSSLVNKHVAFNAADFTCRARYWAVGTAAPGSGKSPALEPLKLALAEVLKENPDLAPGKPSDNFHIQPVGTHCAAVDRLQTTGGYQFFGASEGGPVLCPAWPQNSKWEQGNYVNWQRYLDAATGMDSKQPAVFKIIGCVCSVSIR